MPDEIDEYLILKDQIKSHHSATDFFRFCELYKKIYGKSHSLCYYKSLLSSIKLGDQLTELEERHLKQLRKKYGEVDVEYILICSERYINKKSYTTIFKNTYNDIREGAQKHNKHGAAEFSLLLRNNLDFSYNNSDNQSNINKEALDLLYKIFDHFEGQTFHINENLEIILTPQALIHIITGHTVKHKIPRKGLLVDFQNMSEWYEIIYIIFKILEQQKDEIILSFNNKSRYDNKCISYEGLVYGLHIQKNKCISSFYPVINYKS